MHGAQGVYIQIIAGHSPKNPTYERKTYIEDLNIAHVWNI